MKPLDPFEQRLARTPFRPPPPSLRARVLQTAEGAAAPPVTAIAPRIRSRITDWLWPHPVAWGTLGLAWVLIGLLNFAALDVPEGAPVKRAQQPVTPAWTAALREQRALLNSMLQETPAATPLAEPGPDARNWRPSSRSRCALT